MYRYLVFAFNSYYPTGPGDFRRAFVDFGEARAYAQAMLRRPEPDEVLAFTPVEGDEDLYGRFDWAEVLEYDAESGEMVRVG